MSKQFRKWLHKVGIKTVKTMAETGLALIGTNAIGIMDVDWAGWCGAVLLSGFTTILFNLKKLEESEV